MSRNSTAYRYDDDRYYDDRYEDTRSSYSRNKTFHNTNTFHNAETNAVIQQANTAKIMTQHPRAQKHLHIQKAAGILYALGIMAFLVSSVAGIWLCSNGSMMNYEIINLKEEISKLENENNALISEIQSKSSLERVAKIAVNQLGMVKAEASPYVLDGKVVPCPVAEEPVVVADNDTAIEKVFDFLAEMKDKAIKSSMRFLAKQ